MSYINKVLAGKVHGKVHEKGVWYIKGWCIGSFTTRWFSYKLEFCKTQSESFSHSHQIPECMIKHIICLTHMNVWESAACIL